MFGLGWSELLVVGIVALIVVGPEDLPKMFRKVGQFTGKARQMAREFSRAMNDAADQAGVNEINKTIRAAANPAKAGVDALKSSAGFGGEETSKLSAERAEAKRKISEYSAKAAEERRARERQREAELAEMEAEIAEDTAEGADAPAPAAPKPEDKA